MQDPFGGNGLVGVDLCDADEATAAAGPDTARKAAVRGVKDATNTIPALLLETFEFEFKFEFDTLE